jgi:hypothetical protein
LADEQRVSHCCESGGRFRRRRTRVGMYHPLESVRWKCLLARIGATGRL